LFRLVFRLGVGVQTAQAQSRPQNQPQIPQPQNWRLGAARLQAASALPAARSGIRGAGCWMMGLMGGGVLVLGLAKWLIPRVDYTID
jgi:hypothetical protein